MEPKAREDVVALDNAALVDFLSSAAGVLGEKGLIPLRESDNLRLSLGSIRSAKAERERPLMGELLAQDSSFLGILLARYGGKRLALNMLRHGQREPLGLLVLELSQWGERLITHSKLLFNRPFTLYERGRCDRTILYSSALIDLADVLAEACSRLTATMGAQNHFLSHAMASHDEAALVVDAELAGALGFTSVSTGSLPLVYEHFFRQEIAALMRLVAAASAAFHAHLEELGEGGETGCVSFLAECLELEAARLAQVQLPERAGLAYHEQARILILTSLYALVSGTAQLAAAFETALTRQQKSSQVPVDEGTRADVERRLVSDLLAAGQPLRQARQAVVALQSYLTRKGLKARAILLGELSKIHPSLTPHCLETLQELTAESSMARVPASEKERALTRSHTLAARFSSHRASLRPTLMSILAALGLLSCGLKMHPHSERLDARPDIPFPELIPQQGLPPSGGEAGGDCGEPA